MDNRRNNQLTKRIFSLNKTQSFNINQYTDNRPNFIQSKDVFFFVSPSDEYGFELYQSDGTEEGTSLLLDFNPGPESGIFNFALLDDKLLLNTIDSNDVADLVTYEIATGKIETYTHNFNGIGMREIQKVISAEELTYMHVKTEEEGLELWRSDGTAEGTFLLKDINEGPGSALHRNYQYQSIGSTLYFAANDGINGQELWKTDGSKENTRLVKDIYIGSDGSGVRSLTVYDKKIYFIAESLEEGVNIYSSDGETENTNNTELVTPFGTASSSPNRFTEINDRLVFLAYTNCTGREIFSTQGSAESTTLLKHVREGKAGFSYYPEQIVVSKGFLYFLSHEGESNFNIHRTNGTTGGTELFLSYTNSEEQELHIYHPWVLGAVNDVLLFSDVNTMGEHYLYKVDKDSAKVTIVKELLGIPFSTWSFYQLSDDQTLWIDNDSKNKNILMKTDGSAGGTAAIKEFDGQDIYTAHVINGLLYFLNDGKLWRSDGTEEGTFTLNIHSQDIVSYTSSSSEDVFFNSRNLVYKTDGTKEGTSTLSATMLENGASLNHIKSVGEHLVFVYSIYEASVLRSTIVFYSSENNSWTTLDIGHNNFHTAINYEDRLYFMNRDSIHGSELWTTDGTKENTYMISDINPGPSHFNPCDFYVYQDWIYFSGNSGDGNGRELYKYSPYDKDNDGYLPEDDADDADPSVNVADPNDPKDVTVDCFEIISYTDETEPAPPSLHIYPNPVSDQLNIEFENNETHQVEI